MAMPQRDETAEELKGLAAVPRYPAVHGDEAEAVRRGATQRKLTDKV